MEQTTTCTPMGLNSLRNDPEVRVVDVREFPEYARAHLPGSQLIPLGELKKDLSVLEGAKKVLFVCRTGRRAGEAAELLRRYMPCEAVVLEGGVEALERAGVPLQSQKGPISLERQVRIAAGTLVLLGLTVPALKPLPYLVGAGLVFAGATDACGLAMLLARLPWNREREGSPACPKSGGR